MAVNPFHQSIIGFIFPFLFKLRFNSPISFQFKVLIERGFISNWIRVVLYLLLAPSFDLRKRGRCKARRSWVAFRCSSLGQIHKQVSPNAFLTFRVKAPTRRGGEMLLPQERHEKRRQVQPRKCFSKAFWRTYPIPALIRKVGSRGNEADRWIRKLRRSSNRVLVVLGSSSLHFQQSFEPVCNYIVKSEGGIIKEVMLTRPK